VNDFTGPSTGANYQKARLCLYGTTALVALVDPAHENQTFFFPAARDSPVDSSISACDARQRLSAPTLSRGAQLIAQRHQLGGNRTCPARSPGRAGKRDEWPRAWHDHPLPTYVSPVPSIPFRIDSSGYRLVHFLVFFIHLDSFTRVDRHRRLAVQAAGALHPTRAIQPVPRRGGPGKPSSRATEPDVVHRRLGPRSFLVFATDSLGELFNGAGRTDMVAEWARCVTEAANSIWTRLGWTTRYGSLDDAEEAFSSVLRMDKGTPLTIPPPLHILICR